MRMRCTILYLTGILAACAPASASAQAARVGRLPVLEAPRDGAGACRADPVTPALQRAGIARIISYQSVDSNSHRLVSLGIDAAGNTIMLMAMTGTKNGRRGETESVSVFFGRDGTIIRGDRRAFTTGTPTRLSDDRQLGLLRTDTLAIRRLDAALRRRCRA
jgi:hypothetical protein